MKKTEILEILKLDDNGETQQETISLAQIRLNLQSPISKKDVSQALEAYLNGEVNEKDIESWADFVELSEEISYAVGEEETISEVLFILSSPEINGALNHETARNLIDLISQIRV